MNSRLGIACLSAFALASFVIAGCGKGYNAGPPPPTPSPSPSGSTAPDTIYVQTSGTKQIRVYKGASAINGLAFASEILPTNDNSNPDVVYNPGTDTLWYPVAQGTSTTNPLFFWSAASTKNNMNPDATVAFTNGEGTAAYDPTHDLLFVATTAGPQVSVYSNAHLMTSASTPAATITMVINDTGSPRPQEMLYDTTSDRLFVSDNLSAVAVFNSFGTNANLAVTNHTNPTIGEDREIVNFTSPDGLAYAPASDTLFVGEIQGTRVTVINNELTVTSANHSQTIIGFQHPGALAFDPVRNLLFVYDTSPIWVIPNAITATGNCCNGTILGVHVIDDGTAQQNSGFGLSLDYTH